MDRGWLHILATVNNAAMIMGMCISFQISFFIFFRQYSRVELPDHTVVLFLIFVSKMFSIANESVYIPSNSSWGFPSLTS